MLVVRNLGVHKRDLPEPRTCAGPGTREFHPLYAVCMVGQLIWVLSVMPETKGISLEKIQKQLGIV